MIFNFTKLWNSNFQYISWRKEMYRFLCPTWKDIEDICFFFFWWKIEIYFIEWTPSVIFSQVAQPQVKILPMVLTIWNEFRSFTEKKPQIFCWFHAFNPLWEKLYQNPAQFFSFIPHAINLGNKNIKISIFTGRTSVRSKNIFTDISRYPTWKHEIMGAYCFTVVCLCLHKLFMKTKSFSYS